MLFIGKKSSDRGNSLANLHNRVEQDGVWPKGLLDAYTAMIPKSDGVATSCVFSLLSVGFGLLFDLPILGIGLLLGFHGRSSVLEKGVVLFKHGIRLLLILKNLFLGLLILVYIFLLVALLSPLILLTGCS